MAAHLDGLDPADLRKCMESEGLPSDNEKMYDELNMLCTYCVETWERLKHFFPQVRLEAVAENVLNDEYILSGTMDVASRPNQQMMDEEGIIGMVLDWKFGYIEYGYYNQMMGYAWQIWKALKEIAGTIVTVSVFPRHRLYRVHRIAWHELKQWEYDLKHNSLSQPNTFVPSYRCATCEVAHCCDVRRQKVMQTMADLSGGGADLTKMCDQVSSVDAQTKHDPEIGRTVLQMLQNVKVLEEATTRARSVLKSTVERVGGIPLTDESGNKLELANVLVERKKLNSLIAWPIIQKYMTTAVAAEAATFSLNKLKKQLYNTRGTAKGVQYKTVDDLVKELDDAGAIIVQPIKRMELKERIDADSTNQSQNEGGKDS